MAVQSPPRPIPARSIAVKASAPSPVGPAEVEALLCDLVAAYESLGALAGEHRAAISRADGDAVEACARREAELASRLAELELRRRAVAGPGGAEGQRVTMCSVIERLPEPARGRAAASADRLRDLVRKVQRDYRTIREATRSIVAHIDGLVQQVNRRLNGASTYGPAGRVDAPGPVACGIDLTH